MTEINSENIDSNKKPEIQTHTISKSSSKSLINNSLNL
jgi:hypothetical protein